MAGCSLNNLRQTLEELGYTEPLPCQAVPLVNAILADYMETVQALRETRKQVNSFLQERSCWSYGMEPCKSENSRLQLECQQLREDLIKQQENYERQSQELHKRVMELESEKSLITEQCYQLLNQIKVFVSNDIGIRTTKDKKTGISMAPSRRPFITTVRTGEYVPNPYGTTGRCPRCMTGCFKPNEMRTPSSDKPTDIDILKDTIKELVDQVSFYKKKVQAHDREIRRLNKLTTPKEPCPKKTCSVHS